MVGVSGANNNKPTPVVVGGANNSKPTLVGVGGAKTANLHW